jgi:hypothetical protein
MAAPNIVNVSTITGKTAYIAVTTSAQDFLVNAAASGKVLKVNSIIVANVNGTGAAQVTVYMYRNNTEYRIASTIYVPANSSLVVVSKDAGIYMEEGDTLRIFGSVNSYLVATCSYESIS